MSAAVSPRTAKLDTLTSPEGGSLWSYLRSLPAFRELLFFLVWKDLKVQVAQTALGFGWLVLRPVLNTLVLTLVFGRLARLPSEGHSYLLFLLSGYLPWSYFSGVVGKAANSLVGNAPLVTKVYFPRLLLPTALVLSSMTDLVVTTVFFFVTAIFFYGHVPTAATLLLIVPLLLLLMTTAALSFWLSALAVRFRDVRQATSYIVQMMMFLAPVIWPLSLLSQRFHLTEDASLLRLVVGLYPMTGVVEGFRRALLGGAMPWDLLAIGFAVALLLLLTGLRYFNRCERQMADNI
jgi:lipopolysaccharide transport system permease protein